MPPSFRAKIPPPRNPFSASFRRHPHQEKSHVPIRSGHQAVPRSPRPFCRTQGITVEDADYDYGKVSLAFEDHAKNSLDMLHGGALFTLADMAFGLASNFGQEDGTMISTNATISYMKSAKTGPIVAEARLANGGRHLATYEVKIYDGQGTYIACAMISGYRLDTKLAIEE
ncbi:PaaI family thioesterase [uncultured Bilophila sp.]|uniref:PaaI family thioesterase n=1 Tax=uncultured Bilophila sp. TaxID=529385 RepID=UPI003390004A